MRGREKNSTGQSATGHVHWMCDGDWNRLKKIQEKKKKIKAKAEIEAKLRRAAREAEEEGGGGEGEDVLSTEKPTPY